VKAHIHWEIPMPSGKNRSQWPDDRKLVCGFNGAGAGENAAIGPVAGVDRILKAPKRVLDFPGIV
jgi:hypothetical protein